MGTALFRAILFSATVLVAAHAQESNTLRGLKATPSVPLKVGGDVSAPRPTYAPDPEYSELARKAGHQGTCILSLIVGTDGKPRSVRAIRSLGMELDDKAIEAVRQWRFEPARKDGKPVPVQINVEVTFELYNPPLERALSDEQVEWQREFRARMQNEIRRVAESQSPRICKVSGSSAHGDRSGPAVILADLDIEGALVIPGKDLDVVINTLKQRTYFGSPDEVASEVSDRFKTALMNSGFFKADVRGDGHVLTSSRASARMAVTVQVNAGQQYRLQGIGFRNNRAITNVEALRKLFSINDGDVFDRAVIAKGLENLRLAYGELGYVNFTSVPNTQFNEEQKTIFLEVDVDEGKQFVVSRVDVIGLDEPDFENFNRDLYLQPGDVYNQKLIDLVIKDHVSLFPSDASIQPRFELQLNEEEAAVAITYDFRRCENN